MPLFNLLNSVPNIRRNVSARLVNKDTNRTEAMRFGQAYFDGPREQGYGGYHYDGRWVAVAETAKQRYELMPGQRVLDIGCAKGFLVHDLMTVVPGLEAFGLDVSEYALDHAMETVKERLTQGNALELPYPDNSFDAVFCINTLHNLDRQGCLQALGEINRVLRQPTKAFVQVDAYRNDDELELFEAWMLTAKTYLKPEQWQALFGEADYDGDYFWTILELGTTD